MRADLPDWLDRTIRQRCPRCGDGRLFERALTMRAACPQCDLDFMGRDGAQYGGALVLSYGIGGIIALIVLMVALQFGGLSATVIWSTVAAAVVAIVGSFRYCKSFWTWLLYRTGELEGDAR